MKHCCARRVFTLLAAILFLCSAGCRKDPNSPSAGEDAAVPGGGSVAVTEDGRRMLTGIYTGETVPLPEGMELSTAARPLYDPAAGVLRLLATARVSETVSDGEKEFEFPVDHFSLVTAYPDGTSDEMPVPLHWSGFVACGAFEENGFRYIEIDQSGGQLRLSLKRIGPDGAVETLPGDMDALFGRNIPDKMFLFPDGDTLFVTRNNALLIGADGGRKAADTASDAITDAGKIADGRVFVSWPSNQGAVLAELDAVSGGFGQPVVLGQAFLEVRFGPGYDFYCTDADGVRGAVFTDDGWESEPLLNFINTGLNRAEESFTAPLDPETMAFSRSRKEVLLYRNAPDLDLADLKILTVGCNSTESVASVFASAVSAFQKSHPDVRVVTEDFEAYNTKERPDGGEAKLATDLVTGLYKPDLLLGPADADYMTQAREKGLYRDLMPYLEEKGELFGCVKRLYDDGKGGMWGISPWFSVGTVFADPAQLGEYAGQGYLSPIDFVDLAHSRGEGQIMTTDFSRGIRSFHWLIGRYGCGYRAFYDREAGTASFDSPEFLRVLEYLAALPTEEEEHRDSPFADMSEEERTLARQRGDILLTERRNPWSWVQPELWTGTDEWVMIGYPAGEARSGAGTTVRPGMTLLVTSFSEEPELAQALIGAVLDAENAAEEKNGQFPLMKEEFRKQSDKYAGQVFALFYSGMNGVWAKDGPHPESADALSEPGILTEFTSGKAARLEAMLDDAGTPLRLSDDAVLSIVQDEVLSFLSGVGSASDCAAKIQSRVSLWLSEHQ